MGVETDILLGAFDTLSGAALGYQIAYPNIEFTGTKPYLRINVLKANTSPYAVTRGDYHQGIIQVDVVVEVGVGMITASQKAEEVLAIFPRLLRINKNTTTIRIDERGSVGPDIQEPDGYFIPVSIPYRVLN